MIDPLIRRFVPAIPTGPIGKTAVAEPITASPASGDGFDVTSSSSLTLDGGGSALPVGHPPFQHPLVEGIGPRLSHVDDGWTPQGQGYDAGRGEVLTSYYLKGEGVLLSIQAKGDGEETHQARLGGMDGIPGPTHGGGVSTDGQSVYLSDTQRIYVYSRAEIETAQREGRPAQAFEVVTVPDDSVDPASQTPLVSNGSFMTVKGGYAYVGGYSKDGDGKAGAVWRYRLDPDTGKLLEDSRQGPIRAPDRAQGIAVVDGAMLFTTGDHKLVYQPFDATSFTADIHTRADLSNGRIDSYAQGLNIIDGELWVTYESASKKYDQNVDTPRDHIQRIPLEELDLEAACLTPEDLQD